MNKYKKYRIQVTLDANNESLFKPECWDKSYQEYIGFPQEGKPLSFIAFLNEEEAKSFLIKAIREEKERKVRDLYMANKKTILKTFYIEDIEGNEDIE